MFETDICSEAITVDKRNKSASLIALRIYECESISNQPNLFPVEIHLSFFDVIAL